MSEDEILMEMVGKLAKFSVERTGTSEKGGEWTLYKYVIETKEGERTCTGFVDPMKDKLLNKEVKVIYVEVPNPKGPWPFKNVKQMGINVSKEQVEEVDKQLNVVPIKTPSKVETPQTKGTVTTSSEYDKKMEELHIRKQDEILFGMSANLSSAWALAHRGEKDGDQDRGKMDYWMDKIYDYLKLKRKEKLGY